MSTDALLDGLTEPQREAVTHADGPLLVLAGPGSGKTRVITHRAAYLAQTVTRPWHVLAITFTNKAANEMAERLRRLVGDVGMTCSTFHALCARLLRTYGERVGVQKGFSIFDTSDQLSAMKQALAKCQLRPDNYPPGAMISRISKLKNDMISPERYAEECNGFRDKAVGTLYAAYNEILAEQNGVDFDDLLLKVAHLLQQDADLRRLLEDRWQYVLIDEYQDTNSPQYWIGRLLAQERENICATGDPDQSIYAWRGANLKNILKFEEDFPSAKVVRLEQNYRSTPQILHVADEVIQNNSQRRHKELWTENADGEQVRFADCEDAYAESRFIANEIAKLGEEGMSYDQVAIFYRVNALSRQIEVALQERRIPYQVARGVAFFQRKEIKDILAYLKILANPSDETALLRIINTPTRGIGKTSQDRAIGFAREVNRSVLEVLADPSVIPGASRGVKALKSFRSLFDDLMKTARDSDSVKDTLEAVLTYSGLTAMWGGADDSDAMANANELVNAAAEYDAQHLDGTGSLEEWLQQIALVSDVDAVDSEVGAVTLMTLHAAKGLEFNTVFMAGVEDGLLPHARHQELNDELEEERRLCFVGMTRAMKSLVMTSARFRAVHGVETRTSKSEFVAEIPKDDIVWQRVDADGRLMADKRSGGVSDDWDDMEPVQYRPGQLVRHKDYGLGKLLDLDPAPQRTRARVHFQQYGIKTMILEYAKLEIIDPDEWGDW